MSSQRPIDFQLEMHVEPVSHQMLVVANSIANDQQASLREKLLAQLCLHQMQLFNKLVESLEYGTVTVRVKPENIRRES